MFVCKLGAINKNINKKALAPLDTVQCTMVRKGEIGSDHCVLVKHDTIKVKLMFI